MKPTDPCKFCNVPCDPDSVLKYISPNSKSIYTDKLTFTCNNCNIDYTTDDGELISQSYNIQDDKYRVVSMSTFTGRTVIYFQQDRKPSFAPFAIEGTYFDTKPENIVELANRLVKLIVFA